MADQAEYYRSILDNLTGGLVSVDLEGTVAYINPMAGRILRLAGTAKLVGRKCSEVLAGFPSLCAVIEEALKTRKTVHRAEVSVKHGDAPLVIGYSTLQVRNPQGECLGIGLIFQDLTFISRKKS